MTVSIHPGRFARQAGEELLAVDAEGHSDSPHHEQFPFSYLPEPLRDQFDEALQCHSADLFNAFGLMCRRCVALSVNELDDTDSKRIHAAVSEIIGIGQVDHATSETINALLFGEESEIPAIDPTTAAILVEVMKDVLYQCHVRAARFRAAMRLRRFFAEEQGARLTTLRQPRGAKQTR